MKQLETENARLKKLVAERDLEIEVLSRLISACGAPLYLRSEPLRDYRRLRHLRRRSYYDETERQQLSPDVRERAVRMVMEQRSEYGSQWKAITLIASKIGCTSETLRLWVWRAERDGGLRPGGKSEGHLRIKELERENQELRQANEILRKASAYFTQAGLDRCFKP